jgi:membrane protease YdiL (CAAX protease family)
VSARLFWTRIATVTALAVSLRLALSPPQPPVHLVPGLALALGAAAGVVLFGALSRRRPSFAGMPSQRVLGRQLFVGLCAANEEIVWRRTLLGELLPAGSVVALVVSSAGFAVAHRRSRLVHVGTGAVFGVLYLATGVLGASIAAHWVYNALVGSLLQRAPP